MWKLEDSFNIQAIDELYKWFSIMKKSEEKYNTIFSPAYRRTLETEVSVTDDVTLLIELSY